MLSYSAQNVLAGAVLLGAVGGTLGAFALLRRQSLLGDALAHAALPGVCLAFLLTQSKSPLLLLAGALVAGLLGSLTVLAITRWSRIKEDSAIGIVLSVFFGVGIVLLDPHPEAPGRKPERARPSSSSARRPRWCGATSCVMAALGALADRRGRAPLEGAQARSPSTATSGLSLGLPDAACSRSSSPCSWSSSSSWGCRRSGSC